MKLFVGVRSVDEISPLLDEGVEEFYTGYFSKKDLPTRSHYLPSAGIRSMEELARALDVVHARDSKLFIAVNDLYYGPEQVDSFPDHIRELVRAGVDGIIVANLPLLMRLKQENVRTEICLSTLQPVFNSKALEFFLQFNISRVVLPEHVSAHEVGDILSDSRIKTEAFFWLSSSHFYTESFCLFHHRTGKYLTLTPRVAFRYCRHWPVISVPKGSDYREGLEVLDSYFNDRPSYMFNHTGNLYDYHCLGLDYLKLGTREYPLDMKVTLVKMAKFCLRLLEEERVGREELIRKVDEEKNKYPQIRAYRPVWR